MGQLVCIGTGFFSSPGGMNVALTRSFRVTRRLHLDLVPLHAPFHGPSFPRVPGFATSVTWLPFVTWTERRQVVVHLIEAPLLTFTVPAPEMAIFSETVEAGAPALAAATSTSAQSVTGASVFPSTASSVAVVRDRV
jgi:hypothetical protein